MSEVFSTNRERHFSKKTLFATALIAFLAFSAAFTMLPGANAHTPAWNIPTFAYVTATPNPWGLGSVNPVVIVFWLDIPPPTAAGNTGDRWLNMKVTVTKPSGDTVVKTGLKSDPIGSAYMIYYPDVTGTYKVLFEFPGQTLTLGGGTGIPGSPSVYVGDNYLASQASTTFTVTNTPTTFFVEAPFPVSYWTRPIDSNNQLWTAIASNWLGQQEYGATYSKFQRYGWAPSTAHVMWTYPLSWGGMVGGNNAVSSTMNFYSGTQYQLKFSNPIIMYGNVYFSLPQNNANSGNGIACVNLRTGETLWTNPNINSVSFGQLYDFESPNQHGTTGIYLWASTTVRGVGIINVNETAINQYLGTTSFLGTTYPPGTKDLATVPTPAVGSGFFATNPYANTPVSTSGLVAIDPQTGKLLFNETNIPSGTRAYGPQGEWLLYNIGRVAGNPNAPFTYLWQWNNTKLPGNDGFGGITQWIPGITNYNMSSSYDWNVTLSKPLNPTYTSIGSIGGFSGSAALNTTTGIYTNNPTILRIFPGNLILGQSSGLQQTPGTSFGIFGTPENWEMWAINLDPNRGPVGTVMWDRTYPAPANNLTVCIGPADGDSMVWTTWYKETMQWSGYSLETGDKLWGPMPTNGENVWNYYTGSTGLTNPVGSGYGHLYAAGYSGTLYAYDLKTGNIDFTYGNNPNDPNNSTITVETTYGDFPTQVAAIANNKVYLIEEEHSLNAPPYHGAMTRCVDAFTGKLLWQMYGMCSWQEVAVADGYFVWLNFNDMQVYCNGPGPSSTSVEANPAVVSKGGSVEITGTVLDQSPNIKLKGTPAIADRDQGIWMDYMVQSNVAVPTSVHGVNVELMAIDSTGNAIGIANVTSDASGLFHALWTPPAEGEYVIYAQFLGSDSYGPSSASTAIGVTAAPAPVVTPTPPITTPTPPVQTATPTPTSSPSIPVTPPGEFPWTTVYIAVAAVVIIIIVAAVAVLLRRRK